MLKLKASPGCAWGHFALSPGLSPPRWVPGGVWAPTTAHPILKSADADLQDRSEGPEPALDISPSQTAHSSANRSVYKVAEWEPEAFLQNSPKGRGMVQSAGCMAASSCLGYLKVTPVEMAQRWELRKELFSQLCTRPCMHDLSRVASSARPEPPHSG